MKIRSITCFYHPNTQHARQFVDILANLAQTGTRRFEESVFTLCRKNAIQDVSQLLELGYEAVDGLFKRQAKKRHRHGKKELSE